jgi:hypothetical protein
MKGVPIRRVAIPRVPMPPEIMRADVAEPVPAPSAPARDAVLPRVSRFGAAA